MKRSVRGAIPVSDASEIIEVINGYTLWRLVSKEAQQPDDSDLFAFEAWVNSEEDKNALFAALKPFVDAHGGAIDWHECTHDEPEPQPCVLAEIYAGPEEG